MIVRRYVPADWPQVVALAKAFHVESPVHSPYPFDEPRVMTLLDTARQNPDWLAAVAYDELGIVGMMLLAHMPMYYSAATEVVDLALYVSKDLRGGRAAKMLMEFGERWAYAISADVMRLGITTGIRDRAVERFYAKCGFHPIGSYWEKRLG